MSNTPWPASTTSTILPRPQLSLRLFPCLLKASSTPPKQSTVPLAGLESVSHAGRLLRIALIKNPVGCNQVLDAVTQIGPGSIAVIAINDNLADGTDVSWLWDADFERVAAWPCRFVVAGSRAGDNGRPPSLCWSRPEAYLGRNNRRR